MQAAYSSRELAVMLCVGIRAIQLRAKRERWLSRQRQGLGGGNEWIVESMPESTRETIRAKEAEALFSQESNLPNVQDLAAPAVPAAPEMAAHLKDWQREVRDSRLAVLREVEELGRSVGILKAEKEFSRLAAKGELRPELAKLAETANARKGKARALSASTLRLWRRTLKENGPDALAPRPPSKPRPIPDWLPRILDMYRRPTKPSIAYCYEKLEGQGVHLPSLSTVEREIRGLGVVEANRGRLGPRELKKLLAFKRRDFSSLLPADVFTSDGHCMDLEVAHPRHGRPFRPEVVSVLDVATRVCVGWSAGLAESAWLVADALRYAIECGSIPAIFYVDNGCGYKNAYMDKPALGIMDRLGITKTHSLPYNSQARGVIEDFNKTCLIRAAKDLPAYVGQDMDPEARQLVFKRIRADVALKGESDLLMTWKNYLAWMQSVVDAYNNRPHSTLPTVRDPETGKKRHQTPAEAWEQKTGGTELVWTSPEELEDCFRPYEVRKVVRAEVKLYGGIYFNKALELYHQEEVQVGYDIHDASRVWVRDLDGRLICTANLDANKVDYIPKSALEQAREKRARGRLARLDTHRAEVLDELTGHRTPVIEAAPMTERQKAVLAQTVKALAPGQDGRVVELPKRVTKQDRFLEALELERAIKAKEHVDPADAQWLGGYQTTSEYKGQMRIYEDFGEEAFQRVGNR